VKGRRYEGDKGIIITKRKVNDFNVYKTKIEQQWKALHNTVHAVTLG
jgi:hypothetical protein